MHLNALLVRQTVKIGCVNGKAHWKETLCLNL